MTAIELVKARQAVTTCDRCSNSLGYVGKNQPAFGGIGAMQDVRVAFIIPPLTVNELVNRGRLKDMNMQYLRALVMQQFREEEVAWVPVAGCRGSVSSCRSHLEAQLYAMERLEGVVLVGGDGLDAWRPDQHLTNTAGKLFMMLNRWWCIPIHHPDSIVSHYGDKEEYARWIKLAHGLAHDDDDPSGPSAWDEAHRMEDCPIRRCGFKATWWDPDEVGYCEKHKAKHGGQWRKVRKQWDQWKATSLELRLPIS